MYDIRQFKPALYVVVMLGITGFALAVRSPGLWVLAAAAIGFNGWLVHSGRFTPMPRFIANAATILAFVWTFLSIRTNTTPIIAIGNFLVLLQLVKLFEQRANRDYAQLLVLSLLLMVAASINTASLLFGLLLIGYLFLSLYCCLLFHLKVEADNARSLMLGSESKANPTTLRQDQSYLPRSMRRLTALVSGFSILCAVVVFLFFPRGTGAGLLGPLQIQFGQPMTGFSEQMGYNQVARITQNNELIAYVSVWRDDVPVRKGQLLLRGVTFNRYTGGGGDESVPWQWERVGEPEPLMALITAGGTRTLDNRPSATRIRQRFSFTRNPGTNVLFAIGGVESITTDQDTRIAFSPYSQTLAVNDTSQRPLTYEVVSSGIVQEPALTLSAIDRILGRPGDPRQSRIAPEVAAYARDGAVSGVNDDGPLYTQRPQNVRTHPLDIKIAQAIERHLKDTFSYTLDLTDARRSPSQDPIVGFLTDYKRGHCEYFAGAMTLMCQSLGLSARVVIGFKTDEFNEWENRFAVRQTHAHAWVEVLSPDGQWVTFDPTSGNDPRFVGGTSAWGRIKHLFDYLEYKWANSVVAYDADSRTNLLTRVDQDLTNTAITGNEWLRSIKTWLDEKLFWTVSSTLLGWLLWGVVGGGLLAIGWFMYERWRLRRRAERIGLDILPGSQRLKLVRQLGFYDDLIQLLARYDIHRPPHHTPREFAESLSYLPTESYEAITRLTQIFYRIRYGQSTLKIGQRRRLQAILHRINESLDPV